jgi:hypothetical protein
MGRLGISNATPSYRSWIGPPQATSGLWGRLGNFQFQITDALHPVVLKPAGSVLVLFLLAPSIESEAAP